MLDSSAEKLDAPKRPPVWLVWVKPFDNDNNIIMSICNDEEIAERYKIYLKNINNFHRESYGESKYARIWIEKTIMNHLISINY